MCVIVTSKQAISSTRLVQKKFQTQGGGCFCVLRRSQAKAEAKLKIEALYCCAASQSKQPPSKILNESTTNPLAGSAPPRQARRLESTYVWSSREASQAPQRHWARRSTGAHPPHFWLFSLLDIWRASDWERAGKLCNGHPESGCLHLPRCVSACVCSTVRSEQRGTTTTSGPPALI